jgi:hypothetical protein
VSDGKPEQSLPLGIEKPALQGCLLGNCHYRNWTRPIHIRSRGWGFAARNQSGTDRVESVSIPGDLQHPGFYQVTVRATSFAGWIAARVYTIGVLGITNADPLPEGDVGSPYSVQLIADGGTPLTRLKWRMVRCRMALPFLPLG